MKHSAIRNTYLTILFGLLFPSSLFSQSKYATSDSQKGYVHWIDLYDEDNQRIDPVNNPRPYSPEKTCGRCHDFKTIAHGWHFDAASAAVSSDPGRPGQPLIWKDARTGTYLPLSYRGWQGTFRPSDLGLTNWQVAAKLGGYLPGVAPDTPQGLSADELSKGASQTPSGSVDRSHISGSLPVDCMLCHHRPGSGYSPFVWTEQIDQQNFAYAPTAALGLAVVTGNLRRLKDDFDIRSAETKDQLPQVKYEASQFRSDGKVFIDLVRRPTNDACYYCHTELSNHAPSGTRWMHDQDVHLRAGMLCVDCHHNGLDHQIVRGFEGERHPAGSLAAVWSCRGCHIGDSLNNNLLSNNSLSDSPENASAINQDVQWLQASGRMGAPLPEHRGIPPIHFEKLSCTSCHTGPQQSESIGRQILSIGHDLGTHTKRTGEELPAIFGNVQLPVDSSGTIKPNAEDGKYTPHRLLWPSYWGIIKDGKTRPINPEQAYELLRKPLKVRRDFVEELSEVKLSLTQRREILGDDRTARLKPDELTEEQRQKILEAEKAERTRQVAERMLAALTDLESAFPGTQAVFVSGGTGFIKGTDGKLAEASAELLGDAAKPYAWPSAHAVRPARQSLGATGCQECHAQNSPYFFASIQPIGVLPDQKVEAIPVHQMQQVDVQRLAAWNQMFEGRSWFKVLGFGALGLTALVVLLALVVNLSDLLRSKSA